MKTSRNDRHFVRPYNLFLPLWRRVVFVDWFGVLSSDLFWHSILTQESHPYYKSVASATERLFAENRELVRDWMRGRIDASTIVRQLEVSLDRRCNDDFLLRRLMADCRRMSFRKDLLLGIRQVVPDAYLLIATDNMDCFVSEVEALSVHSSGADDILVSCQLGVLKLDSVEMFFGPWLRDHALSFRQAILIDDNPRTCDAFRQCGGDAILFTSVAATLAELEFKGRPRMPEAECRPPVK